MWVIAVYDCPMIEREERRDYTLFRKSLLQENFFQLQNSLYVRHFPTMAVAEATIQRIRLGIPAGAQVAFFLVTDKQNKKAAIKGVRPYIKYSYLCVMYISL